MVLALVMCLSLIQVPAFAAEEPSAPDPAEILQEVPEQPETSENPEEQEQPEIPAETGTPESPDSTENAGTSDRKSVV